VDSNRSYVLKVKRVLGMLLTINIASERIFGMMTEKSDLDGIGNNEHYTH
jgi:hypothetical protein